jgi:hypothetical protein
MGRGAGEILVTYRELGYYDSCLELIQWICKLAGNFDKLWFLTIS